MEKKVVLIFSGNNQRAVIAFCRYASMENIPFAIIANGSEDSIFQSSYTERVIGIRVKDRLEINQLLQFSGMTKQKYQVSQILVLPSTEYLNRFLLRNQKVLEQEGVHSGLCDETVYSLISDKLSFSDLCKSNGIPVPQEFSTIPSTYPFVIKPKEYVQGEGKIHEKPILVLSEEEFKELPRLENLDKYYFQEYVDGPSFYLLYYFSRNGKVLAYSQENLIQQAEGASMICAKSSTVHQNQISDKFIQLFKKVNFYGLVMVEVKFDGNKFVMIEANPRFWGPSQLILDANMMIFDAFSFDNHLKSAMTVREYKNEEFYFWSGGIVGNQKEGKAPKFYDYNKSKFYEDYSQLMKRDIYLREDTLKIYLDEIS